MLLKWSRPTDHDKIDKKFLLALFNANQTRTERWRRADAATFDISAVTWSQLTLPDGKFGGDRSFWTTFSRTRETLPSDGSVETPLTRQRQRFGVFSSRNPTAAVKKSSRSSAVVSAVLVRSVRWANIIKSMCGNPFRRRCRPRERFYGDGKYKPPFTRQCRRIPEHGTLGNGRVITSAVSRTQDRDGRIRISLDTPAT